MTVYVSLNTYKKNGLVVMKNKIITGITCVCLIASGFIFSQRSKNNLSEVHEHLQALTHCALASSKVDFIVIDGLRTAEEHQENLRNGKSWTKRSRHQDGLAVDVAAYVDGKVTYDPQPYHKISEAFYLCSKHMNIPLTWGGEWRVKDLMHFELNRTAYP